MNRQGIPLAECSTGLPHLTIDHDTGVLFVEAEALSNTANVLSKVRACETALRSLWLLVLLPDRKQLGSATATTSSSGPGSGRCHAVLCGKLVVVNLRRVHKTTPVCTLT